MRPPSTASAVARFIAGSVLAIAVVVVGAFFVLRSITIDEAERDRRAQVLLEGRLVESAALEDGVLQGDRRALEELDGVAVAQILSESVVRVKLWTRDGRIIYSDEPRVIGRRFELDEEELALFRQGGAEAELSDLSAPENFYERQEGELLEAYTVIRTPSGTPVLFETYQRLASVNASGARLLEALAPPLLGGLAVLLLFQVPLALSLARRLQRGHAEREELLRNAVDSSQAERRRIASDLHDGVVQDLAGVAFGLAPLSKAIEQRGDREDAALVRDATARLRQGIRDLRSLLVEIHPPALESAGLEAALADLLSPLAASGLQTSLLVDDSLVAGSPDDALIYRVAREALRNVADHAHATSVRVVLAPREGATRLEVVDDGRGFAEQVRVRRTAEGHMGLTLLEGLVRQAGGRLEVRSSPGAGTSVTLELGSS